MCLRTVLLVISCLVATASLQADFSLDDWQQRVAAENDIDKLGRL